MQQTVYVTHTLGQNVSIFLLDVQPLKYQHLLMLGSQKHVYLQAENVLFPSQRSVPSKVFISGQNESLSHRKHTHDIKVHIGKGEKCA